MPFIPEAMLRRTISVNCPEWGHISGDATVLPSTQQRIDCALWLRCPEVPGQDEESKASFSPPLSQGFSPGLEPTKDKTQPGDSLL